jgi:hypothetical protein
LTGYQPIKYRLSAPKFAFFEKFIQLNREKTPIYIVVIRANTAFLVSFKLRARNFLPIKESVGDAPSGCAARAVLHGLVMM